MNTGDFHLNRLMPSVPDGFEAVVEQVVLVERLRVVTAAMGFTRISAVRAFGSTEAAAGTIAPLSRTPPKFVPAGENRGEGIFIQFKAAKLAAWRDAISKTRQADFERAYARWKGARNIQPPGPAFPGMVYLLLHSLSHALMRQLTVECGYPAASVRERLYVREIDGDITMAGILLYTAAPDAEGTLGGLVRMGMPDELGRHIDRALRPRSPSARRTRSVRTTPPTSRERRCTAPAVTPACSPPKPRASAATAISIAASWSPPSANGSAPSLRPKPEPASAA
jgi:hypothetical protein